MFITFITYDPRSAEAEAFAPFDSLKAILPSPTSPSTSLNISHC